MRTKNLYLTEKYELSNIASDSTVSLNEQELVYHNSKFYDGGELRIWVDEFPNYVFEDYSDITIEEQINDPLKFDLKSQQSDQFNPYIYTGKRIAILGRTYYLWKYESDYEISVKWLLTNTIDYNTLRNQSLCYLYDNGEDINSSSSNFSAFQGILSEDNELYIENSIISDTEINFKLVRVDKLKTLEIYIDPFDENRNQEGLTVPFKDWSLHSKTDFCYSPEKFGSKHYILTDTILDLSSFSHIKKVQELLDKGYTEAYVWEFVPTESNSNDYEEYGLYNYLITSTNDYDTLFNESMRHNINCNFDSFISILNEDNGISYNVDREYNCRLIRVNKVYD